MYLSFNRFKHVKLEKLKIQDKHVNKMMKFIYLKVDFSMKLYKGLLYVYIDIQINIYNCQRKNISFNIT